MYVTLCVIGRSNLMASGVLNVQLSADAYLVCLTHALSAEKEEVMGVLLGEVCGHYSYMYKQEKWGLKL